MKKTFFLVSSLILSLAVFCQSWTADQLKQANTAAAISELSGVEKEAIMYINLARLFPKEFAVNELTKYSVPARFGNADQNAPYKKSLSVQLNNSTAIPALYSDHDLFVSARCFAKESGDKGTVGHKRKNCATSGFAECCSYGMDTGKDIAMQWLIDDKVGNLAHRKNCLNQSYSKIGLSVHAHKKYGICAVADMSW